MSNVAEKSFLTVDIAGETLRHGVNGLTKTPQFIASSGGKLDVEMAVRNLTGGDGEAANGASQIANERQPTDD